MRSEIGGAMRPDTEKQKILVVMSLQSCGWIKSLASDTGAVCRFALL